MKNKNTVWAVLYAFAGCLGAISTIAPGTTSLAGSLGTEGASLSENVSRITYTNSMFAVMFFGMGMYVMLHILADFRQGSRRRRVTALVFSLLLSAALHMGALLESTENVNFKDWKLYVGTVLFGVFLSPIADALWNRFMGKSDIQKKNNEKPLNIFKVWMILMGMWIPTFLALFPGAFVYDAADEYLQVKTGLYTMHHPLLHVLMLGKSVCTAEEIGIGANAGIAFYTFVQMLIFAFVLAFLICKLQKWGAERKKLLVLIPVFGLFPIFPMYAVCSAKDTLFTAAFLVIVIYLVDFIREGKKFFGMRAVGLCLTAAVMMLLRNNGAYALLVSIPVIALIGIATDRKNIKNYLKLAVLLLLAFSIYKGADYGLKLACNASDNEHQEILTVPIQQLGRVYRYAPETFSEEEKETLYSILPENYLITYTARCSDVLKSGFNNGAYEQNPSLYRKLWFDIIKRKPLICLNGWLVNSYGYWYPDMIINVYGGNQLYTFKYGDSSYFGFETEPPGNRHSLFPMYERFYRNISLELFQQRVPVISMLFSPGFMFWILAWAVAGLIREKRWKTVVVFVPVLLLWATVLLGPTVLVRYVLILWCVLPIAGMCNRLEA